MKQLVEKKLILFCLVFLSLVTVLSALAYFLIPDGTNNANRQLPQLALSAPGTVQKVLISPKDLSSENPGILHRFIFGSRDLLDYTPYDSIYSEQSRIHSIFQTNLTIHGTHVTPETVRKTQVSYWLGSDKYGRDILSRLILGLRISLIVGFLSVLVSITIGIAIGSLGGYYGGWIDKVTMLIINTSWSIPTLLMAFAIIIAFGKGFLVIVLAVGLTMWVDVARIVRGQVLQVKSELYVQASKVLGFNDLKIITRHILPNIMGSVLVMAAANFATAILVEAGLSYLGLGIQPPTPSLGNMLQESYAYATGGFVYLALFPILTIMSLVLCFNLLGTGMRDLFDVKSISS